MLYRGFQLRKIRSRFSGYVIRCISTIILLGISFSSFSQKKKKEDTHLIADHAEWFEGSIMLTDGRELKGLVKYNSRNGVLSFQDGNESKVFTPLRVAGFEFYDESIQKQRIFYTLEFEDSETSIPRPLFFEVLKEYKTFAILAKSDRIDIEQKLDPSIRFYSNPNQFSETNTILEVSQTETIYFMRDTGEIKPYTKVVNSEDGIKSLSGKDTKTKNKIIDRDLLEEFISEADYKKLIEYANANDLNFKVKSDLLRIFDHYDELISK